MSAPSRPRGPIDTRLLRLARPAGFSLVVLVVLSVVQAATALGIALGAGGVVVSIVQGDAWEPWLAVLAASLLARTVAAGLLPRAAERVSATVIAGARRDGLRALARRGGRAASSASASASASEAGPTGDVAVLLTTGLEPLRPWFASYLPSLVVAAVLPAAAVVALAVVDWPSATTVLLTLPLVPVFAALIGWATQRRADAQYERGGRLAGHFLDVVRGLVTLRLFDRAERQVAEVRRTSRRYARATTKVLGLAFLSSTALDLVATVSVGLVAVGAGVRLAGGELGLWTALVAILLAPEAYRPLREAGAQFHASAQAGAVMDRLQALLGDDAPPAAPVRAPSVADSTGARASDVVVHFRGRRRALRLPDLTVAPGEVVALLGPSGSGKTTLLRVLAGRQAPLAGSADADGALLVPQRPTLPLARTVREALTLAGGDAAEVEARAVLDAVGLAAVGLDAPLGDDGTGLSQGQRHRVALAAAALRTRLALAADESVTLLLDEPTAHLDATSERNVVALLTDLARDGAAVLVATHRPAVAEAATRVVTVTTADEVAPDDVAATRPSSPGTTTVAGPSDPDDPPPTDTLLAGLRRRWDRLAPRARFALAAAFGAASLLSGIGLTVAASWMIVRADSQPPILTLSLSVVAVRAFAIARPLWRYLERLASHDAGLGLLARWRGDVVAALIPLVPGRLTARRGALLARVVDDVDLRLDGVVRGAVPLASGLAALAVVGLGLVWLLPAALVPFLVATLLAAVVAPRYLRRADRREEPRRRAAHDDLRDAVVGGAENLDVLDGALLAEIETRAAASERAEVGAARTEGVGRAIAELAAGVAAVGIALVAALTAADGGIGTAGAVSPETVGILVLGSLVLGEVLVGLAPASLALQRGRDARRRLRDLAAEAAAVRPAAEPEWPADRSPDLAAASLDLRDVSVGWDGRPAVAHVSLPLDAGRTHAIRWPSGTGKSTLAAVLLGLRPPLAGTVRVAGLPPGLARERGLVALAGDADHVFATTVRENLRLARPEADDDELVASLLAAHLGPWWASLEHGLDTWITAEQLSGGERRRLVLARALLRDPEVLVLDEPTAGLDPATAAALLGDLREDAERRGRALLVMEHRPSGSEAPPSAGDAVLPRDAARADTDEMPLGALRRQ